MKHAYLIIAHHDFDLLRRLVRALDDVRNDIYIHIDLKVRDIPPLKVFHAGLFLLPNRIDVRWGDISQIETEYCLYKTAFRQGIYAYYHLLSGVDMPIKSQNYIHSFFQQRVGTEFIGFQQADNQKELRIKIGKFHCFPKSFKESAGLGLMKHVVRSGCLFLQKILGYGRNKDITIKKGPNWCSLTESFVQFLIEHEQEIYKRFHHSFCADEIYKQTLCWNSSFRSKVYDIQDEYRSCVRAIDWSAGMPKFWSKDEVCELVKSSALFARKFSGADIATLQELEDRIQ